MASRKIMRLLGLVKLRSAPVRTLMNQLRCTQ